MEDKVTIGTFNIRYAGADDGPNSWDNRKQLIIKSINRRDPDIIGFQEVLPHVKDFLDKNLSKYIILGNGRTEDLKGEYNCIAIKKDIFEVMTLETIWLSDTPYLPGSQFENNDSCPRIATGVTLRSKVNNRQFRVFNTHLDHRFPKIRLKQLGVLDKFIEEYDNKRSMPTFLTGDLNSTPESEEVAYILQDFKVCFKDLSTIEQINSETTFHGFFYDDSHKSKIDYIFAAGDVKLIRSHIDDTEEDGIYLSDHFPIYCDVQL